MCNARESTIRTEASLIWLDTFGRSAGRVSKTSGSGLKTWGPEFGTWVSLGRDSELSLVWERVRSAVQFSSVLQLWGTLTHTPMLLCVRFPGQGVPAYCFGPNWSHEPSASWGEEGKGVFCCSAGCGSSWAVFLQLRQPLLCAPEHDDRVEAAGAVY